MIYRFGEFELDTRSFQLQKAGSQVAIEPQVLDLLKYLVFNRDRLVPRNELFDEIWSGKVVSDTSLSNHVKSARKAIGDDGQAQLLIKTVHGRGYQFIAKTNEIMNHGSDLASLHIDNTIGRPEHQGPFVAVLPFQNLSSDPEQQYFAEGMSEDITTELSRFSDIQVIARHSTFQFTGARPDIDAAQCQLGVEYLVEGSVRRTQDRVRINAQLIDANSGKQVWAEKYDRPGDQVFQIQDEITETIVSTISGQIRRIETDRANSRGTTNLRAYDHLLRGLAYHKNGHVSYETHVKANTEFGKAIELDPVFPRARAWAVCATASMWVAKTEQNIHTAIDATRYALSLDENESETHRGWYWQELGIVQYSMGEYQQSLSSYYKNWELDAYDLALIAASHIALGDVDSAREAARKALEKEPKASVHMYTLFETYQDKARHQLLYDRMIAAGLPK